jgi:hypothetical protein
LRLVRASRHHCELGIHKGLLERLRNDVRRKWQEK